MFPVFIPIRPLCNVHNAMYMYIIICNVAPLLIKILFADDTCIHNVLLNDNNLNTLIDLMNTELISLNNLFKTNKLSLNTKKSLLMIFQRSRIKSNSIGSIIIDSSKLIQVNHVKYLGMIIDYKLNWIEHIAYVKNKISKGYKNIVQSETIFK